MYKKRTQDEKVERKMLCTCSGQKCLSFDVSNCDVEVKRVAGRKKLAREERKELIICEYDCIMRRHVYSKSGVRRV